MIDRLVLSIIAFTGIIAGFALAFIAPEEIRMYRRHLVMMSSLLFSAAVTLPMYAAGITAWIWFPMLCLLIFLSKVFYSHMRYAYPMLAFTLFLLSGDLLALGSFIIFSLGLPLGTLALAEYIRDDMIKVKPMQVLKKALPYMAFLVIAALNLLVVYL